MTMEFVAFEIGFCRDQPSPHGDVANCSLCGKAPNRGGELKPFLWGETVGWGQLAGGENRRQRRGVVDFS